MKRTTLRTSAIALGVAAALPATAQEWNLGWGGFVHQHVAFGNNDVKVKPVEVKNLHYKVSGDHNGRDDEGDYEITVKFAAANSDWSFQAAVGNNQINDDGEVFLVPTEAARTALRNFLDLPDTSEANDQIKKVYIESAMIDSSDVYQAMTLEQLNEFLGDDSPFSLGANQKLNGMEIIIVDGDVDPDDVGDQINLANAYDQAVSAAAAFNADPVNKAVKRSGGAQHSNMEVHFKPSVTLDSGLTFAATIEFEGDDAGIDESSLSISSESLGTLKLGKHGAPLMMVGAPSVGLGINSGDHPNFIPVDHGSGAVYSTAAPTGGAAGKQQRISYQTPANMLGGLQAGLAYAVGNTDGRNSGYLKKSKGAGEVSDIIDFGVKFAQPFGESNVALSMRYSTAKQEGAEQNPREFGIGAEFGFGGFTVGGAYADTERESSAGKDLSSNGWNLGISYAMEAWKFGIETYQGEYDNGDEHSVSKIAASRTLGPGVSWDFYALTASSKKTVTNTSVGVAGARTVNAYNGQDYYPGVGLVDSTARVTEKSGTAFGTAIKLTF